MVTEIFDLQKLQVEDAANPTQRPKFELDAAGCGMALLKVLDYVDSTSDVHTGQLAVFIGPWYAVTVRYGQLGDLRGIRRRLQESPELRTHGPVSVVYAVLDQIVDGDPASPTRSGSTWRNLETAVFAQDRSASTPNSIYRLKREEMSRCGGRWSDLSCRLHICSSADRRRGSLPTFGPTSATSATTSCVSPTPWSQRTTC